VTISATDADNDPLTYSGSVSFCTGSLNAAVSSVNCPNTGFYTGNVTVQDPDGNADQASFTIGPCQSGSVTP